MTGRRGRAGADRGARARSRASFPSGLAHETRRATTTPASDEHGQGGDRGPRGGYASRGGMNSKGNVYTPRGSFGANNSSRASQNATCHPKAAYIERFRILKEDRPRQRAQLIKERRMNPDGRIHLSQAVKLRGLCTEMCPEFERVRRIVEDDLKPPEYTAESLKLNDRKARVPDESRMVKAYQRSAAGMDTELVTDIRTPSACLKTMEYMITRLDHEDLEFLYPWMWDRTRAVRKDLRTQSVDTEDLTYYLECFEQCARLSLLFLHHMSKSASEDYSHQQDREQMVQTFISLKERYHDNRRAGIPSPNEAELRAYQLVSSLATGDRRVEAEIQCLPEDIRRDGRIQTAMEIYRTGKVILDRPRTSFTQAQQNFRAFWTLIQSNAVSYLMACAAEIVFRQIRQTVIDTLYRVYRQGLAKETGPPEDWTVPKLLDLLGFDTAEEVDDFCQLYGFSLATRADGERFLVFDSADYGRRKPLKLPAAGRPQTFSLKLVEVKRFDRLLSSVIRDPEPVPDTEDSLFIPEGDSTGKPNPFGKTTASIQTPAQSTAVASSPFINKDAVATKPGPAAALSNIGTVAPASNPFVAPSNPLANAAPLSGSSGPSLFSQPTSFGQPSNVVKPSPFGQPASVTNPSPFGQPSTVSKPSPFGQPSSASKPSPFEQPSTVAKSSPFGQPSSVSTPSVFGQNSGFGKPSVSTALSTAQAHGVMAATTTAAASSLTAGQTVQPGLFNPSKDAIKFSTGSTNPFLPITAGSNAGTPNKLVEAAATQPSTAWSFTNTPNTGAKTTSAPSFQGFASSGAGISPFTNTASANNGPNAEAKTTPTPSFQGFATSGAGISPFTQPTGANVATSLNPPPSSSNEAPKPFSFFSSAASSNAPASASLALPKSSGNEPQKPFSFLSGPTATTAPAAAPQKSVSFFQNIQQPDVQGSPQRQAQEEQERKIRQDQERRLKEQQEQQRVAAEQARLAQQERERRAREDEERRAREEQERRAREEQERLARQEKERQDQLQRQKDQALDALTTNIFLKPDEGLFDQYISQQIQLLIPEVKKKIRADKMSEERKLALARAYAAHWWRIVEKRRKAKRSRDRRKWLKDNAAMLRAVAAEDAMKYSKERLEAKAQANNFKKPTAPASANTVKKVAQPAKNGKSVAKAPPSAKANGTASASSGQNTNMAAAVPALSSSRSTSTPVRAPYIPEYVPPQDRTVTDWFRLRGMGLDPSKILGSKRSYDSVSDHGSDDLGRKRARASTSSSPRPLAASMKESQRKTSDLVARARSLLSTTTTPTTSPPRVQHEFSRSVPNLGIQKSSTARRSFGDSYGSPAGARKPDYWNRESRFLPRHLYGKGPDAAREYVQARRGSLQSQSQSPAVSSEPANVSSPIPTQQSYIPETYATYDEDSEMVDSEGLEEESSGLASGNHTGSEEADYTSDEGVGYSYGLTYHQEQNAQIMPGGTQDDAIELSD